MKRLFIVVVVLVSAAVLSTFWWFYVSGSVGGTDSIVEVQVEKNASIRELARMLRDKGLIRSRVAFFVYVKLTGLERKIQAGNYKLSPAMTLSTLASSLTLGISDLKLTIPEGWRVEQIAEKLGLSVPATLEGRLFPDTYYAPSFGVIVGMMQDNFVKKVPVITDEQLIVASLVEREGKTDADRPLIASVIYNRLKIGMKLDIDATIQYAIGYTKKDGWWKRELTLEDLKFKSPYNTYINPGLPPGPICNPGLAAILAAIDPPQSDYFYYISDKSGVTHFAKTLSEHNANVAKYLER